MSSYTHTLMTRRLISPSVRHLEPFHWLTKLHFYSDHPWSPATNHKLWYLKSLFVSYSLYRHQYWICQIIGHQLKRFSLIFSCDANQGKLARYELGHKTKTIWICNQIKVLLAMNWDWITCPLATKLTKDSFSRSLVLVILIQPK